MLTKTSNVQLNEEVVWKLMSKDVKVTKTKTKPVGHMRTNPMFVLAKLATQ